MLALFSQVGEEMCATLMKILFQPRRWALAAHLR
jgi:hypothetical protein